MSYLFDTNVVSELVRRAPDPRVLSWVDRIGSEDIYLSVITLAEISYGIEAAAPGPRRQALVDWYDASVKQAQILPIDRPVAEMWAVLRKRADLLGRSAPPIDTFIAATAEVHRLTVATRNTRDFDVWGGPVFDPWTAAP